MTAHRISIVSTGTATIPPASDADTRLLKKIHAIRPMPADREGRKNLDKLQPRRN